MRVPTAHTWELAPSELTAVRGLLEDVFAGDFSGDDWDHTLGGVHALVWEGGEAVAHGSVVQRRLLHRGRALRCGYVEGVAVRADRRGRGLGAAVLETLERVVRGGYVLGALSSTESALGFYAARGWRRWAGPTWTLTASGRIRTPEDDGAVYVLPAGSGPSLDPSQDLTCDLRDGEPW